MLAVVCDNADVDDGHDDVDVRRKKWFVFCLMILVYLLASIGTISRFFAR